jgi:hypothetical protein
MCLIQHIRDYFQHWGCDLAFPCPHCQQQITLMQCPYDTPGYGDDGTVHAGFLHCPQCGQDASHAAEQAYGRSETAYHRKVAREDPEEEDDDDPGEET